MVKAFPCHDVIVEQGWVSSGRNLFLPGHPEKKWKKPISSSFVRTKLEETGQNWKKLWKMSEMLDLSGTPGVRPIGLSPGSWQTSLGLGSMSRYSAQILICITKDYMHLVNWYCLKTWCKKIDYFWPISSSFIRTKLKKKLDDNWGKMSEMLRLDKN